MSTAPAAPNVWTAEMLERLPDDGRRRELVRGELIEMAPVNLTHARIVGFISAPMIMHVRRERLGEVYVGEPGFHLEEGPDTVLGPDLAFVRTSRVPTLKKTGFPKGFPDLAVEVLSPSNTATEMLQKIETYLRCGVTTVWIIDPRPPRRNPSPRHSRPSRPGRLPRRRRSPS